MRHLTFMHLAEGKKVIAYSVIQSEMGIPENQVEQFIIDGKSLSCVPRQPSGQGH